MNNRSDQAHSSFGKSHTACFHDNLNGDASNVILHSELGGCRKIGLLLTDAVFECTLAGVLTYANKSAETLFGVSDKGITAELNISDMVSPQYRERMHSLFGRVGRGETVAGQEIAIVRDDGTEVVVVASCMPVRSRKKITGIFGVFASTGVRWSNLGTLHWCVEALECLDIMVLVVDRDQRVQLCNASYRQVFGPASGEAAAKDLSSLRTGSPWTETITAHIEHALQGELRHFEFRLHLKDENVRDLLVTVCPVSDGNGAVSGATVIARDITSYKQLERTLHDQNEYEYTLLDSVHNPVFLLSETGVVEGCNSACENYFGLDRNRILGKPVSDMNPEDREKVRILEQIMLPVEQVSEMSLSWDGDTHAVLVYRSPYRSEDGSGGGRIGTVLDISRWKRIEKKLKENTELLEGIFAAAHIYIAYMDADFTFIRVNRVYAQFGGHDPEYYPGKNHFDLYPDDKNREIFRQVVETGTPYHTLARPFVSADHPERGVTYWDWSLEPVKDVRGTVNGLLLLLVNVTDQERSRQALRQSEERFRDIFASMPVPTTMFMKTNGDFEVIDYNRAADRFTEGRINKLIGMKGSELFRDRPDLMSLLNQCITDRTVLSIETPYRFVVMDEQRYVHFTFAYVHDNLVLSHWQDVTERKRTMDRLLTYQSRLQSLSSELTLAEERERRRVAEYLHDRIGHNLSLSQMQLETLRDQVRDPSELDEIIGLLNTIVNETRTLTFELSPPVLYELGFDNALDWLAEQGSRKYGLPISVHQQGQVAKPDLDIAILLFQSVQEILFNVAKHAEAKSADITIAWMEDSVRIIIQDNGIGFDTSVLQKAPDETKGFGLFKIGERMQFIGGTLEIESIPGRGTTVTLTSPLKHRKRQRSSRLNLKWFA